MKLTLCWYNEVKLHFKHLKGSVFQVTRWLRTEIIHTIRIIDGLLTKLYTAASYCLYSPDLILSKKKKILIAPYK